jgi:hypothetical protein
MTRILIRILVVLMVVFGVIFWALFFSPRPPLTTDPAVFSGDGSQLDYCALPALDGSGKNAIDIPKGNTPGCSYQGFPMPILAQCTEPLPDGASDIRGLWKSFEGRENHVERIEQCGSRTVISTSGVIHDYGPNSTLGLNTNDVEGPGLGLTLFGKLRCPRTSSSMIWDNEVLDFNVFGFGPTVVRRYLEGDVLVWEYANGTVTKMRRICTLPNDKVLR